MRIMKAGATSQSIYVEILDSTSTTGARKTGLAFNTSSLTGYYTINGASAVAITLATLAAANSAWSSGGFKEVDATNAPGLYRLDIPNAAIASGASSVITLKGATGMVQVSEEIMLVPWDPQDGVRQGLTALPNAAAEAAGGLYTRGSGAGQINQPANGQVDINLVKWLGTAASTPTVAGVPNVNAKTWNDLTTVALPLVPTTAGRTLDVSAGGEAGVDWANVGSPTTTLDLSGTTIKTTQVVASVSGAVGSVTGLTAATVHSDLDDIQARLPAALTANGNMKSDTLRVGGTVQTAGDLSAQIDAVDNFVDTEVDAIKTVVDAVKVQTDKMTFTVANQMDSNVLDWKSATAPAMTGDAYARIGANGVGLTSVALSAAGIQAVWDALSAALTTANSIGKRIVDNLNATVSSRSTFDPTLTDVSVSNITSAAVGDILTEPLSNSEASWAARCLGWAAAKLTNRIKSTAGTLTVYKTDDSSALFTQAVTASAAADPITELDTA